MGLVTLRQLRGEGPDPLAQLDSYIAGIIQTVWVMPPLLRDGNWAVLGMMIHLPTDMEIEDAQRDCEMRLKQCRWKAIETSVELSHHQQILGFLHSHTTGQALSS